MLSRSTRFSRPDDPTVFGFIKSRGTPLILTLHDLKKLCPACRMLASDGVCERRKGGEVHNVLARRCIEGSATRGEVILLETIVHRARRLFRRYVDRFAVPSRFPIGKGVEWGWPRESFAYVRNCLNPVRLPAPDPGEGFLYVGCFAREEGLRVLIEVALQVRVPPAIAGDGPDSAARCAHAQARGAGLSSLGQLPMAALAATIRAACAVVLPFEWYESALMSILKTYVRGATSDRLSPRR